MERFLTASQSATEPYMTMARWQGPMPGQTVIALTRTLPNMLFGYIASRLIAFREGRVARAAFRWRWLVPIGALVLDGLQLFPAPSQPLVPTPSQPLGQSLQSNPAEEPITPIPAPPAIDPRIIKLGARLFDDVRLSHDNSRSCSSCHDLGTNGASKKRHDVDFDGSDLPFNTLTIFNAALSFRFGWEGKLRTIEAEVKASLENPQIMGSDISELAKKIAVDADIRREFTAVYGRGPDAGNIVDVFVNFERTLVTPDSRFDRWLAGDATALSAEEADGYQLFKSLGCVSCHQGVNIGGNLFERHGIFHPLASPQPEILRVPSLRNVATTAPYFHDGSAPTLDDAVRKMGLAQLNSTLTNQQVKAIVAYLRTLTGNYQGAPVGAPR
jgi:cytochrome c peroxidase